MPQAANPPTGRVTAFDFAVIAALSFLLYLVSAVLLDMRYAILHFGADGHLYEGLAQGVIHDRIARFHPVTVAMASVWKKLFGWLSVWVETKFVLKAMPAAAGAAGVAAAVSAFAVFMRRREALLCGAIYAVSFGVWYFASIEESKIVTAAFAAFYIAIYLHVRENLNTSRIVLLSAVLCAACLNEITSCFLAAIPAAEFLLRRSRLPLLLLIAHIAAGCAALAVLEFVARVVLPATDSEGATHASMFFHYFLQNDRGLASFRYFASNWLFFNIAAPSASATHLANAAHNAAGYFSPGLAQYSGHPFALAALVLLMAVFVSGLLRGGSRVRFGILLALAAYSLVRGAFFFAFNPPEPLLFSPAATLAHLLILIVPFARSDFRWKGTALAAIAASLFLANGAFFLGA